jgi:hypothetical protein
VSLDLTFAKRRRVQKEEVTKMERLVAGARLEEPAPWKGKRYRRREEAGDEAARQRLEKKERAKAGQKIINVIFEAGLPLAQELREGGRDHTAPEAERALQGLRTKTLEKRSSDFEPLRRWLKAERGIPFPQSTQDVLDFYEVRRREGAARTSYESLRLALAFYEEGGEVPRDQRLSSTPTLTNAVKEAAARKARQEEEEGQPSARRQAPPLFLSLILALEIAVCSTALPIFQRCYAWYRLLRHWASLRYDDTAGLPFQSLELRARGLVGTLKRTKTTGTDKKVSHLPIFVAFKAYVGRPWLREGFALWQLHMGYVRDYLLCLPTENLCGTVRKKARYSDCVSFSKALLAALERPGVGDRLVGVLACLFWTEHSDRAGIDSWVAALGVPSEMRAFLGRWSAAGSQDVYVRTSLRVCENLQVLAAKHARRALHGGPDYFGEEHLGAQLTAFLTERGLSQEDAEEQAEKLRVANYDLDPTPFASITKEGLLEKTEGQSVAENEVQGTPFVQADVVDEEGLDGDEALGDAEITEETVTQVLRETEADEQQTPQGFVCSVTRDGRFKRLHFVGGCFRVPGEHYKKYRSYGQELPAANLYNEKCKDCFPKDAESKSLEIQAAEDESVSDASSESSVGGNGGVATPRGSEPASADEADAACPSFAQEL